MYSNVLHTKRGIKVLGDNLKKARKNKHLSQKDVAEHLNISDNLYQSGKQIKIIQTMII